jgi:hypothetical protein
MTESMVSTRAQIIGVAIIAAVIGAIGFWMVTSGALSNPVVHLRNESAGDVNIGILGSNGFGDFSLVIPPWTDGMCATAQWGTGGGNKPESAAFVSGLETTSVPLAFPVGGPYYVRVDASGAMHTGEPVPEDQADCAIYPLHDLLHP